MARAADAAVGWRFEDGPDRRWLVLCDHASNRVPAELRDLGLDAGQLQQHIAWDPGAAGLAAQLAQRLSCPAFYGVWSRLLVDLNRAPDRVDLIPETSDGIVIPGNASLDASARVQRIARYHAPYHAAIVDYLQQQEQADVTPALIAIHSFTPVISGFVRPWHAGVVWQLAAPWLPPLLEALSVDGHEIGDNQPYDGAAMGYTLEHLGVAGRREHVMFEVRQDLLSTEAGQHDWADRLLGALRRSGFPGGTAGAPGAGIAHDAAST